MLRIDYSLVVGGRTGMPQIFLTALLLVALAARAVAVVNVLVEAESFTVKGGWRVDRIRLSWDRLFGPARRAKLAG
jgi:hypothetical protein